MGSTRIQSGVEATPNGLLLRGGQMRPNRDGSYKTSQ